MTSSLYVQKPVRLPTPDGFFLGYTNPTNDFSQSITASSQTITIPPSQSALLTGPTGSGKSILIRQNINRQSQRPQILYERIPSDTFIHPKSQKNYLPWETIAVDEKALSNQAIITILRHLLTHNNPQNIQTLATSFFERITNAGHEPPRWLHQIIEANKKTLTPQKSSFIISDASPSSRHHFSGGLALALFLSPTTAIHKGQITLDDPYLLSPFATRETRDIEKHVFLHKAALIIAAIDTFFIPNVLQNNQETARIALTLSSAPNPRQCGYGRITDTADRQPQTFWFPLDQQSNLDSLSSARKQAKDILASLRIKNPDAKLAQAYETLATQSGYKNWATMKAKLAITC